jgi:hypothetical protein
LEIYTAYFWPQIWRWYLMKETPKKRHTQSLFFARSSLNFAGFRSLELRSLASVEICNVELCSLNSSEVRLGATVLQRFIFYFVKYIFWRIPGRIFNFFSVLSYLGIEPRIFGFKVNTGGQVTKQPTNFRRKILNLCNSNFFAENLFWRNEVRVNKISNP